MPCKDSGYFCSYIHINHSRDDAELLCCTEDATAHGPACASIPSKLRPGRGRRSSIVPATSKRPLRNNHRVGRRGVEAFEERATFFLSKLSVERSLGVVLELPCGHICRAGNAYESAKAKAW